MLLKLQEGKHLKHNAQRREAYLREKIKLPEDLVLFWEEQEKALGAKGHQWHPKQVLYNENYLHLNVCILYTQKLIQRLIKSNSKPDKVKDRKSKPRYLLHFRIIWLCITIWTRSPEAYHAMATSEMLRLPSGRLL